MRICWSSRAIDTGAQKFQVSPGRISNNSDSLRPFREANIALRIWRQGVGDIEIGVAMDIVSHCCKGRKISLKTCDDFSQGPETSCSCQNMSSNFFPSPVAAYLSEHAASLSSLILHTYPVQQDSVQVYHVGRPQQQREQTVCWLRRLTSGMKHTGSKPEEGVEALHNQVSLQVHLHLKAATNKYKMYS